MKIVYETPAVEMVELECEDIILTSFGFEEDTGDEEE